MNNLQPGDHVTNLIYLDGCEAPVDTYELINDPLGNLYAANGNQIVPLSALAVFARVDYKHPIITMANDGWCNIGWNPKRYFSVLEAMAGASTLETNEPSFEFRVVRSTQSSLPHHPKYCIATVYPGTSTPNGVIDINGRLQLFNTGAEVWMRWNIIPVEES